MKRICILVAIISIGICNDIVHENSWQAYKEKFNKEYSTASEDQKRQLIWEKNLKEIADHNAEADLGMHSWRKGVNAFTDLSHEEFLAKIGTPKSRPMKRLRQTRGIPDRSPLPQTTGLPATLDWRNQGCVTKSENQLQCGSNWAFAATGAIEGAICKKTGRHPISLSAQQLVDCSGKYGNGGCNGGLMTSAFEYVIKNNGIATTESYPYEGQNGPCRYNPAHKAATISSYIDLPDGNETALQIALANYGPVAVAFDLFAPEFQDYKSGVLAPPTCKTVPNHGSLLVGYGNDSKDGPYWIVRNTWGPEWGMDGYVWIAKDKNNMCGIASMATYVLP